MQGGVYALGELPNPATLQKSTVPIETSKDLISHPSKKKKVRDCTHCTLIQNCWERRESKELKNH